MAKRRQKSKRATAEAGKVTKTTPKGTETEELEMQQFADNAIAHVSVSGGFTRDMGGFESGRYSVMVTLPCAAEATDEAFADATERLEDYLAQLGERVGAMAADFETEAPDEEDDEDEDLEEDEDDEDEDLEEDEDDEDDEEDEDDDEDEEELDPEDVLKMKKAELVELIEEYELEVDPKDHKKIADLRQAVHDELFEDEDDEDLEDEDEDDEELEDEDDEDEDDEDEDEDEDEEEGLEPEDLLGMSHKELSELAEEYESELDPSDFKKTKAGTKKFAEALIEELFEDGEEDDEDEEDEESDTYTEAELEDMDVSELKEIFKGWELGSFPKGKNAKTKAISIIMEVIEQAE